MKTIKYSFLVLLFGTLSIVSSIAQNIEQIHMKSGSIVEGYIAEQKPGKHITVQTTRATIVVNSDSLKNRVTERVPFEELSAEWQEWAEENNKYIDNNGSKCLELSTLEFRNCKYTNVFLLEKGSIIKFLDLTPNTYKFVWGDMFRTVKNRRPENLFSGLKEVLVLTDNSTVSGQIIEQFPGKDLKIMTDDGEILSFKFTQVKQIKTEKLNEKLELWTQIQFLDKIRVKGESSPLIGFISSRTLGKEMTFDFENGDRITIPQNQVTAYSKIPNEKYAAVYERIMNLGDILLNGKEAYFVSLESQEPYLLLGETVSAQFNVGDTVCLEAKLSDINTPITLVKAHLEQISRQNGRKTIEYPWPVISYQDLVQSQIAITRETTLLGNIKISFDLEEVGDYVIHIQGMNEYIVINVIEKTIEEPQEKNL